MRMTSNRFEHLFTLVRHRIEKKYHKNSETHICTTKTRFHAPSSSYKRIPTITESQLSYWEIKRLSNCFGNSPGHKQFHERSIYENAFIKRRIA